MIIKGQATDADSLSEIARFPTEYVDVHGRKCHESLVRSFHTLRIVRGMIDRHDSPETIQMFLRAIDAMPGHANPI